MGEAPPDGLIRLRVPSIRPRYGVEGAASAGGGKARDIVAQPPAAERILLPRTTEDAQASPVYRPNLDRMMFDDVRHSSWRFYSGRLDAFFSTGTENAGSSTIGVEAMFDDHTRQSSDGCLWNRPGPFAGFNGMLRAHTGMILTLPIVLRGGP